MSVAVQSQSENSVHIISVSLLTSEAISNFLLSLLLLFSNHFSFHLSNATFYCGFLSLPWQVSKSLISL